MAVADGLDVQLARPEAVLVEEVLERLEYQQRLALVGLSLLASADDVVGGDVDGSHTPCRRPGAFDGVARIQLAFYRAPQACLVDSPFIASFSSSRAIVIRCTSLAPS